MRQIKAEMVERQARTPGPHLKVTSSRGDVQQIKYSRKTCVSLKPIKDIPNKILSLTCQSSPVMAD